jgi:hypothetical protein
MDKYQDVRSIPLRSVLASLGFTGFKKRAGKQEWYGVAPSTTQRKTKPRSRLTSGGSTAFLAASTAPGQSTWL